MTIFQEAYDAIKNWVAPNWLKQFLADLQTIIIKIAESAGEAYLNYLEQKIIEAAKMNTPPSEKFTYVFNAAKASTIPALIALTDSELNTIINAIVSLLKNNGTI